MEPETPEEKWSRIQRRIQQGILTAYPNPDRKGCPSREGLIELVVRSSKFDDSIEDDPQWQHVTHCSPCYRQYLEEFDRRRRLKQFKALSE